MRSFPRLMRRIVSTAQRWYSGEWRMLKYLDEYESSQFESPDWLQRRQFERLRQLLAHAEENCPFYRERFREAGLHSSDIISARDLQHIPIVTRADLQKHRDQMVATNWRRDDLIENRTGGSTGEPVSFFLSQERHWSRMAATIRHNRWAGFDLGKRVAVLWGAACDQPRGHWARLRSKLIDRQLFLDTGHLTEAKLLSYHDALQRYRPKMIVAYARSALLLARFLRARGVAAYQPRSIITSAEVLTEEERQQIEATFGCPVFNRYGCREVSVVASECDRHEGMHVMAEGLLVEVVGGEANGHVRRGETGAIIITDLLNQAMPLIRYRIGDFGSWADGACACGRGLPRLREVAGRVTDFLLGTDGRLVAGAFLTLAVVAQRTSLGQIQIIQDAPGRVLFRIKPGFGFDADWDFAFLFAKTRRYLGQDIRIDWEFVDEIAAEASGKYAFCRSTVLPDYARTVTSL